MYRFLISLRWSDKANTLKMDLCLNLLDCPGTQSVQAGKSSACQGCPNQKLCSSGAARAPDPGKSVIIWSFDINRKRLDSSSDSYSSWIKCKKEKDKSVALSRPIFLVDPYFLYFLLLLLTISHQHLSSPPPCLISSYSRDRSEAVNSQTQDPRVVWQRRSREEYLQRSPGSRPVKWQHKGGNIKPQSHPVVVKN